MSIKKIAQNIPSALWDSVSKKLIDRLLKSSKVNKLSSNLVKSLLQYWKEDKFSTEEGLTLLFKASMLSEPEKTINLMEELNLPEIVENLKEIK